jgi:hypothetical protein
MDKFAKVAQKLRIFFLVLLVGFFLSIQSAQARIIGIVHDDSGSMGNSGTVHLPAFGAQFIISTLDGQTNPATADRLFYTRLNQSSTTKASIGSQQKQQNEINRVRKLFSNANGAGTSIKMVGDTLVDIVNAGRQDEEIYLIVIADGAFGGDYARFQKQVQKAAKDAKGPVRTEFIFINSKNDSELTQNITRQNIFPYLNTVFNGDPNDGIHTVTSFDEMFAALRKITARISGTENVGQGTNITVTNDTMTLDSPFSISRIVAVSTSDTGRAPPKVVSKSFTETQKYTYETGMDRPDTAAGWNRVMAGTTQHFTFQPALQPGVHSLTFDQKLGPNSFLLFESEAVVDLELFDKNGVKLTPDATGVIEVSLGEDYGLQAQVFSQQSAGAPVAFSALDSSATFKSNLISPAGSKTTLSMVRNDPVNRADGSVTFSALGEHGLYAVLRWPGFVSPTSRTIKVRVLDRRAELKIEVSPFDTGPNGQILFDVAPPTTPEHLAVADLQVTDATGNSSGVIVRLDGAPDWLSLRDASDTVIGPSDVVPLNTVFRLFADGSQITSGAQVKDWPVKITAEAATPARGIVEAQVVMLPRVGPVKVTATGHSKDSSGQTPMEMSGTELRQNTKAETGGVDALDYEVRDTLIPPEMGVNVEVVGNPPFGLRLRAEVSGNSVTVFPETAWWCPCVLYFTSRPTRVSVLYDDGNGLQRAQSDPQILNVKISGREAIFSCLMILAMILLILYLIKALANGMATQRFPKLSIAEIDTGEQVTRKPRLRGTNFTFFKVLLWPIFGVPHERTSVQGLALQARRGGCYLLMNESNLSYESDTYDDLKTFRDENPKKDQIAIGWLEEFTKSDGFGERIRLLRNISEAR